MEPIKVESWFQYIRKHPDFTGCLVDKCNNIYWFKNGKWHREDGPAWEYSNNGDKWWYLNGVGYTEQEWIVALRKIKLERVLKKIDS